MQNKTVDNLYANVVTNHLFQTIFRSIFPNKRSATKSRNTYPNIRAISVIYLYF